MLGVICLVTGILAIVWPGITLLTLGIFAGIYLLVTAIMEIIDAIFGEPGGRALSAILGIISLIAGLIFIRRPGESLLAIVIVAGIFLVAEGVIRDRPRLRLHRRRAGGACALGLIDAIVGIVILAWPGHRPRHARGLLRGHDGRARRRSRSWSASSCAASRAPRGPPPVHTASLRAERVQRQAPRGSGGPRRAARARRRRRRRSSRTRRASGTAGCRASSSTRVEHGARSAAGAIRARRRPRAPSASSSGRAAA